MTKIPAKFIHVGFLDFLCDALYQYEQAQESHDLYVINRCARASIVASALSIESCANLLIQKLDIPVSLSNDLDKLPAISKIETYFKINCSNSSLNFGSHKVQKIKELITIRNQFVHPKSTSIKTDIEQPRDGGDNHWHIPMTLTANLNKSTNIPKSSMLWSAESAFAALETIFDFYAYIFNDLIDLESQEDPYFLNHVILEHVIMPNSYEEFENQLLHAKLLGLNTSFLSFIEQDA